MGALNHVFIQNTARVDNTPKEYRRQQCEDKLKGNQLIIRKDKRNSLHVECKKNHQLECKRNHQKKKKINHFTQIR